MKQKIINAAAVTFAVVVILLLMALFTVIEGKAQGIETIRDNAIRECVATQYTQAIGVREASGKNDGVDVKKYLASVKLPEGHAWCAAFVNYVLKKCGANVAGSGWSPAWFPQSRLVFNKSFGLGSNTGTLPQRGDVFGIYFPNKGRIAHVGFIDVWEESHITTVEGNTNDAGSREGDGVYKKKRLTKQIHAVANWISL